MADCPFAHIGVPADKLAVKRGGVYHGGLLLATAGGTATVAVYDGLSAGGELIGYFSAAASAHDEAILEKGLTVREGIYVDRGDNVSAFTLYYDPPTGEDI